jgi:hypothetical protein
MSQANKLPVRPTLVTDFETLLEQTHYAIGMCEIHAPQGLSTQWAQLAKVKAEQALKLLKENVQ